MKILKGYSRFFLVSESLLSEALEYGSDSSHKLSWRKRFRYIIIGTELQCTNFVVFTIACREYYDRSITGLTNLLAH